MAGSLGTLLVTVGASIDGFEKNMGTVSQRITAIDRQADRAFSGFDRIGSRLTDIGGTLTGAVTVPLGAIAAAALMVAKDFEQSMAKIKAFGDISGDSLEKLRQQALKLGADTQFSAQQAADAMAVFASANFNAEQIAAAMPGTLQLAAAGMITVGESAKFVADVLGQFGLAASDTGRIADVMAAALKDTQATMGELASTLTFVGPIARGAGQSLEETTASIIALDVAGIRGEKAGTGLRGVIASLVAPSTDAAKHMAALGIQVEGAGGKMLPISNIMEQFRAKLGTVGSEVERNNVVFQVFGREAGNAASVLINTGGPALDAYKKQLLNSSGAAQALAKTLNSGLNFALEQLKGSVETAGIALGTALIPVATRVLEIFTKVVNEAVLPAINWFSQLPVPVQNTALAFAGIAAAIGPMLVAMGLVLTSIGSIATAFTSLAGVSIAGALVPALAALPGMLTNVAFALTNNLTGALAGGELAMARFGQAALVAAAAFGGWKLGEWAYSNIPGIKALGDAISDSFRVIPGIGLMIEKVTGISHAEKEAAGSAEFLRTATQRLEAELQKKGITVDKTGKSFEEYRKALITASAEANKGGQAHGDMRSEIDKAKATILEAEKKAKVYAAAHKELGGEVKRTAAEHKRATALFKQFGDGIPALIIAEYERKLHAAKVELAKHVLETGRAKDASKAWETQLDSLIASAERIGSEIKKLPLPTLEGMLGTITAATGRFDGALKTLGITSTSEFKRVADEAAKARDEVLGSGIASDFEKKTAIYKAVKAQVEASHAAGIAITADQKAIIKEMETKAKETKGIFEGLGNDISTVFTNTAQSIAKSFFDGDLSVGEKFKTMAKDMGEAVLAKFIEPATKAIGTFISDVIGDLLSGKGLGGIIGSLKDIGSSLASIFGAGANAASTAVGAAGTAAGAGGQVAGTAGQAAGAAASGLAGIVTAVSSVVSAISDVFSNFQFAAMNKSLDLIENYTRYTKIWTGEQSQSILWSTQTTAARLIHVYEGIDTLGRYASEQLAWLGRIGGAVETMATAQMAGAGGLTVVFNNPVVHRESDIQDIIGRIGEAMRETGQTI